MALPCIWNCNASFSRSNLVSHSEIEETKEVDTTSKKVRNYISDDITFCILSKLPLKSLKRFECVCTSWVLLFQNNCFLTMYRNNLTMSSSNHYDDTYLVLHCHPNDCRIPTEFYLLSGERFKNRLKIDWPPRFQEINYDIYILGSVSINGIFCLKQKWDPKLVLWNPTTREFKVVPPSPFKYVQPPRFPFYVLHGFGYDRVTDDYKVIQFVDSLLIVPDEMYIHDRSSYETFWEIYSLRSNSWRKLNVGIPNRDYYTLERAIGVYTNGVSHWWARTDDSKIFEECLVSFDFSNEVLITTPSPSYLDVNSLACKHGDRRLVLLNDSIAMISTYLETSTFYISILGELGVRESWTKLFIVENLPLIEYPIGVGKKSNVVFFKKTDGKLAWVDLSTNIIEQDLGVKGWFFGCHVGKYKKSFLRLGGVVN